MARAFAVYPFESYMGVIGFIEFEQVLNTLCVLSKYVLYKYLPITVAHIVFVSMFYCIHNTLCVYCVCSMLFMRARIQNMCADNSLYAVCCGWWRLPARYKYMLMKWLMRQARERVQHLRCAVTNILLYNKSENANIEICARWSRRGNEMLHFKKYFKWAQFSPITFLRSINFFTLKINIWCITYYIFMYIVANNII